MNINQLPGKLPVLGGRAALDGIAEVLRAGAYDHASVRHTTMTGAHITETLAVLGVDPDLQILRVLRGGNGSDTPGIIHLGDIHTYTSLRYRMPHSV